MRAHAAYAPDGVRGPIVTPRACTHHAPRSSGVGGGSGVRSLDGVVKLRVGVLHGKGVCEEFTGNLERSLRVLILCLPRYIIQRLLRP